MSLAPPTVEPDAAGAPPVRRSTLLFALVSGIVAWFARLAGGSALVPMACAHDVGWVIDLWTVLMGLVCVAGVVAATRVRRRAGIGDDGRALGYQILGYVALLTNVLSLVLVVAEGSMHLWFGACR